MQLSWLGRTFALFLAAAWCGTVSAQQRQPAFEPADEVTTSTAETVPAVPPIAANTDDDLSFIEHDCALCHQVDSRTIGPAYRDIANRYAATDEIIQELAKHVIEGIVGRWGDTPMAAHSALSLEEAQDMVKRILALKAGLR